MLVVIQRRERDPGHPIGRGDWCRVDRRDQLVIVREPILGILRQETEEDRGDGGGDIRPEVADIGSGRTGMSGQLIGDVAARKGGDASQEVVEGTAE